MFVSIRVRRKRDGVVELLNGIGIGDECRSLMLVGRILIWARGGANSRPIDLQLDNSIVLMAISCLFLLSGSASKIYRQSLRVRRSCPTTPYHNANPRVTMNTIGAQSSPSWYH